MFLRLLSAVLFAVALSTAKAGATIYCDNAHDDAAAINAALAALPNGGTVTLPNGRCLLSYAIQITNNNVFLVGAGGNFSAFTVSGTTPYAGTSGTSLVWAGSSGATMLYFDQYNTGTSSYNQMVGGGVENITFIASGGAVTAPSPGPDCTGSCVAGQGIQPFGLAGGWFQQLSFQNGFSYGAVDLPPIGCTDTMHNTFINMSFDNETSNFWLRVSVRRRNCDLRLDANV